MYFYLLNSYNFINNILKENKIDEKCLSLFFSEEQLDDKNDKLDINYNVINNTSMDINDPVLDDYYEHFYDV